MCLGEVWHSGFPWERRDLGLRRLTCYRQRSCVASIIYMLPYLGMRRYLWVHIQLQ